MNNVKHKLWLECVNDFKSSGLICKVWCDEHQISISTMG
ncbi:IS66 family insertion sequence element accessory protein TnpA [Agathobacter rectalis]